MQFWFESEFHDVFGVKVRPSAETADQIYDQIAACLTKDEFRPRALYHRFNIEAIATTDDPRYVVGLMMDHPQRTADGQPGTTSAPLFHNIASWLLQRENVPLSPDPGPRLTLQAT